MAFCFLHPSALACHIHYAKEFGMNKAESNEPEILASSGNGIVEKSLSMLKPWPGNPRTHSEKQLAKIKASIRKFGFTAPVLIDEDNVILSGHGRVMAAKELGLELIPTREISGLSQAKKRAYVIADNKIAEQSKWDGGLLKSELNLLMQEEFDIETTGFSTAEIDLLFDDSPEPGSADPDDLRPEDVQSEIVSRLGDLWVLGSHRLLCGNSLDAANYELLLQGQLVQLVIQDPPFNVPIKGHVCGSGKIKHKEFAMASGEMTQSEFTAFLNTVFSHLKVVMQDGAILFNFMDWRHMREVLDGAGPVFGEMRQLCVWAKDNGGMGSFYRSQHELVFVFKKGDAPHINNFELGQFGRYRTNVWNYPGVNTFKGKGYELLAMHPTVKPVSLIADALRDCSHRKGIVLDPFAGSGTILIAAERTGRHARAIEFDPQYVDVAIARWQRITGKQAVLESTGQTWEEVRAARIEEKNHHE
jgi:DNA modification methylase